MPTKSHRGLALVEILAIGSMMAIGLGLLVPALGAGRSKNYLGHELGNLRALMQVAFKYANDDPNNILGPVHPAAPSFFGEGYAEYGGGPGAVYTNAWGGAFDPSTRPLNHLMYGTKGLQEATAPGDPNFFREFQCLGQDRGWQTWPGFGASTQETEPNSYYYAYGTSFRMNNLPYGFNSYYGIYGRSRSAIPAPSTTLAFMEARVFETIYTNDAWGSLQHGELKGYHDKVGYFVVSYCDGRAGLVDFGDGTYYQHVVGPAPYNSSLDVRGTWGRMDCLPGGSLSY